MDMVFSVLASPLDASHRKLVGRALECATMTGKPDRWVYDES